MEAKPNTQTISWFNQQNQMKTIDLKARFQRDVVWSSGAQAYLIDTCLRKLPMPEIYLRVVNDDKGNTTYQVVDGKQRLTALFKFLNDDLVLQDKYSKDIIGLGGEKFTALPVDMRRDLFKYDITVVELHDATRRDIKDIFERLNRTGAKLNKQELRHAAYEGDFIQMAEEVAKDPYLVKIKMFGTPQIRRMLDIEFVSELLMMVAENKMQGRKKGLDKFYADNEVMGAVRKRQLKSQFQKVLKYIKKIVADRSTRFVNKGDFYTLFYTMNYFVTSDFVFHKINLEKINETLSYLTLEIREDSKIHKLAEYYNSTQEAVDSFPNRNLRFEVLRDLFEPMMAEKKDARRNFTLLQKQVIWNKSPDKKCGICGKVVRAFNVYEPDHIKKWAEGGRTEIFNGRITHRSCNRARR
jgi:hypothetical protein